MECLIGLKLAKSYMVPSGFASFLIFLLIKSLVKLSFRIAILASSTLFQNTAPYSSLTWTFVIVVNGDVPVNVIKY